MCQNMTMPGPETELCGVKWHFGVVRGRRLAAVRPGVTLGAFNGPPWARVGMSHLACLNGSPGRFGWLGPRLRRGPSRTTPGVWKSRPNRPPRDARNIPCGAVCNSQRRRPGNLLDPCDPVTAMRARRHYWASVIWSQLCVHEAMSLDHCDPVTTMRA